MALGETVNIRLFLALQDTEFLLRKLATMLKVGNFREASGMLDSMKRSIQDAQEAIVDAERRK